MLIDDESASAKHAGACFAFGELPASIFQGAGGKFQPIGLALLQEARRRRRRRGTPFGRCLLPEPAHAHVHTVALDLSPMEHPSTHVNWPAVLQALARDAGRTAAVTTFQAYLRHFGDARPSVETWLAHSRGLVWRNGRRVPISSTYERIRTTIPLVNILKTSAEVADTFGHYLADPERHQRSFLLTCVNAASLGEQEAMLASVPQEEQADAIDALYGHVFPDSGQDCIIALPIDPARRLPR